MQQIVSKLDYLFLCKSYKKSYSEFATTFAKGVGTPLLIILNFAESRPGPKQYLSSTPCILNASRTDNLLFLYG